MSFGDRHNYLHGPVGFNYRMTDSQAALALKSLEDFESNFSKRQSIEKLYEERLPGKILNRYPTKPREAVWIYDVCLGDRKDSFVKFMNAAGVAARHGFKPMSMQPLFNLEYKNLKSYKFSKEICYLPVNPFMTESDVNNIADLCRAFLSGKVNA